MNGGADVQALVTLFVAEEKPTRLIHLIAAQCPRSIAAEPMELYLARLERLGGIAVLFDSYKIAVRQEPRTSIIAILRDAFRSLSVRYADDNEFAGATKDWYLTNKNGLRVNPYYHPDSPIPDNQQLFIAK